MQNIPNTITQSGLRVRGWSLSLITKLLGEPDYRVPNPVYKSSPELRLYNLPRVEEAEKLDAFKDYQQSRLNRKAGAVKAVETKRQRIKQIISDLKISVPRLELSLLSDLAIDNYNEHHYREWADDNPSIVIGSFLDWSEPDTFRDRICVNYLRHRRSGYHNHLEYLTGRIGGDEAYLILFKKIIDQISVMYPELALENAPDNTKKRLALFRTARPLFISTFIHLSRLQSVVNSASYSKVH